MQFGKDRDDALSTLVDALNAAAGYDPVGLRPVARPRPTCRRPPSRTSSARRSSTTRARSRWSAPRRCCPTSPTRAAVRQRARAAGPGVQAQGRARLRRLPRRGQPLQVQGRQQPAGHRRQRQRHPGRLQRRPGPPGARPGRLRRARSRPTAAPRRSSWWVTSTPTPRRTRCRCSTRTGYVNQASDDSRDTSATSSTAWPARSTTCWPARRPRPWSPGATCGRSTPRSRWRFEYSRYNYNATLLYQPNQFRASDHNPELVGLDAPFTQQASTVSVTATPDRIKKKKDTARVDVTVTAAGGHADGGGRRSWSGGQQVGTSDSW